MILIDKLPEVKGNYRENSSLAKVTWFQVGGAAEVLFRPFDVLDLSCFLKNVNPDIPITVFGVGSNILVRDGGVDGVVIRMGRNFANMYTDTDKVVVGAGCLDVNVAKFAMENGLGGLEFLVGIPGTIGGALAMNAGAYRNEIKDVLVSVEAVDGSGRILNLSCDDFGFSYRKNSLPKEIIFTSAVLQAKRDSKESIKKKMDEISAQREETQPIRSRTGGSTFKNPHGQKAWQLIDKAGCRGLVLGGAQVSEKHCNFLINNGDATASDLEELGEEVRKRVKENSGIELEWEIKIIGKKND